MEIPKLQNELIKGESGISKENYESWLQERREILLRKERLNDYVAESKIGGEGLFAKREFLPGEIVSEYLISKYDKLITDQEIESDSDVENNVIQVGLNEKGEGLYVAVPGHHHRNFVNHSCEPNAGIRILDRSDGVKDSFLFAIKPIKKDEEICIDYGTTQFEKWDFEGCHCGSPNCRGTITEFQRLPNDLKDKYIRQGLIPEFALKLVGREKEPISGDYIVLKEAEWRDFPAVK